MCINISSRAVLSIGSFPYIVLHCLIKHFSYGITEFDPIGKFPILVRDDNCHNQTCKVWAGVVLLVTLITDYQSTNVWLNKQSFICLGVFGYYNCCTRSTSSSWQICTVWFELDFRNWAFNAWSACTRNSSNLKETAPCLEKLGAPSVGLMNWCSISRSLLQLKFVWLNTQVA